jgi:hypothetical protein
MTILIIMNNLLKNITYAFIYFVLSTIITWWFIQQGAFLYISPYAMVISCSIAGAKWGIQIVAALLFLQEKKWVFIKRVGFTCFVGSCLLLPYCMVQQIRVLPNSFLISLAVAVVAMIAMYYKAVMLTSIKKIWFWGWMACLAIAISLQLFVVFKIV